jgi:hypothetical protein
MAAAEHVAAHDVRAHAFEQPLDHLCVGVVLDALQTLLGTSAVGRERPLMKAHAALSDRVLEALVRAGDESVQRNGDLAADRAHILHDR